MANKQVLDALMDVFNAANYRFLTLSEITEQMHRRGFRIGELGILDCLCNERASATYPFIEHEEGKETVWGLEAWFPKSVRSSRKSLRSAEPLSPGWETKHTISLNGQELSAGTFPLRPQNFANLVASMDEQQLEHSFVTMQCYGSEQFVCSLNHDNHSLEGKSLQRWYKENGVQPGDAVWLVVEATRPLALRVYTEWDRDADVYRRHIQQRQLEQLPYINLSIRDLMWLYFKRTQKVAHRSEISKAILADRPEISDRSIDGCLHANPHLFVRTGERGNWGLREWGVEQVTVFVPQKGDDPSKTVDTNRPKATYPLDYVLAIIHGEDLVYRVLQSAKASLSYSELTERIARYLGVNKSILERTSFLDVKDVRLIRLQDGTFQLRESLEEIIREFTAKENDLRQALDQATEDHQREARELKEKLASVVAQFGAEMCHARAEITRLGLERSELASQLEVLGVTHNAGANESESQSVRSEQLEDTTAETIARLVQVEQERAEAQLQVQTIQSQLIQAQRELDARHAEDRIQINELEQQILQLKQLLEEVTRKLDETSARLVQAERERDETRRHGFVIYAELMRLKQEQSHQISPHAPVSQLQDREHASLEKHLRIVIADDQEVVRIGIRALLDRHPNFIVVDEAASAKESVAKVLQHGPDVVVISIRLPGSIGIEVCKEITRLAPQTKVIVHASLTRDDLLFEAISSGAAGYVLEQSGGDDLVRAIEAIGRGESLLDPALTQRVFSRVREATQKDEAAAFAELTDQELRVLSQVAEGKPNREIAQLLSLSEGTVRNYVSSILSKLHLTNRAEAAAYAVEHNLRGYIIN